VIKNSILFLSLIALNLPALAQNKHRRDQVDSVSYYISEQQYEKAISLLSSSIKSNPNARDYMTRGLAVMKQQRNANHHAISK